MVDARNLSDGEATAIAKETTKIAAVRTEEVAILSVCGRWKHLHFLMAEAPKDVGFIL